MYGGDEDSRTAVIQALACPHCRAGEDGETLGLLWDSGEGAWRCLLCGHRTFDRRHMTYAEYIDDQLWDRIIDLLDEENSRSGEVEPEEDYVEAI